MAVSQFLKFSVLLCGTAPRAGLKEGSPEFQAADTLERGSKARDWSAICSAIGKFASQFTSAALAHLAGACLSQLFHLGHSLIKASSSNTW